MVEIFGIEFEPGNPDRRKGTRDEDKRKEKTTQGDVRNVGGTFMTGTGANTKVVQGTPEAYVYKGKGSRSKGDFRVNISKDLADYATSLGVEVPSSRFRGNRSNVEKDVKTFNSALQEAEARGQTVSNAPSPVSPAENDPFNIAGNNAANPEDYNVDPGPSGEDATGVNIGDPDIIGDETAVELVQDVAGGTSLVQTPPAAPSGASSELENFDEPVISAGDLEDSSDSSGAVEGGTASGGASTILGGAANAADYSDASDDVITSLGSGATLNEALGNENLVAPGQTSAASGIVSQMVAANNSTGAAEDQAISDYTSGTVGDIFTSPGGLETTSDDIFGSQTSLMNEDPFDDGFLRPRRGISGGLLS